MEQLRLFADTYLSTLHIPKVETIQYSDILEILILSILIYHILIISNKHKSLYQLDW